MMPEAGCQGVNIKLLTPSCLRVPLGRYCISATRTFSIVKRFNSA